MFYFLFKVLYALVAPVSLIILFLLLYLIAKVKNYLYAALVLLLVFSNPFITQKVVKWYEAEPVALTAKNQYAAIILASGFSGNFKVGDQMRTNFSAGSDRMWQVIDLFHRGISKRIIFTGGADTIFGNNEPEAKLGKAFLIKCGIPDTCIWIETASINTYQNAVFTANMLQGRDRNWKEKKYVLVTSAYHMKRALLCFQKQGFQVDPYPSDFRGVRSKDSVLNTLLPDIGSMELWTLLIKEWIGLAVYKVKGYI